MPVGLSVALVAAAQAVAAPAPPSAPVDGPVAASASNTSAASVQVAQRQCSTPAVPDPKSREIVVCAVKPYGYRLDPDVLAANRAKKKGESVRPRNPHETFADHSCATIGPMGCRGQVTIDAFTAAAVLAEMSQRLAKGQEIGSMFQTTPAKGDYQLYLEAKKQREEQEADKAAKAKAAAAQAAVDSAKTGASAAPVR
jgi:hypothetical protein